MDFRTRIQKLIFISVIGITLCSCHQKNKNESTGRQKDSVQVVSSAIELSRQIERDPSNPELYYQRSNIYFNEKYLDRALLDINRAIELDVQSPLFLFNKARILYAMNKTKDAAMMYESAIALKPDYEEAQMKLAELYYIVKEHKKSVDLLNAVLAKNKKPEAYFYKGMNQKETNDTGKAIASFQLALEAAPDFYDAAIQLGLIFTAKKNKVAVEYFNLALRLSPKSTEAYFARAYYYQVMKEYQKALFDYRKVIDIDPSNDAAYYNVGIINFEVKQFNEALRSWNICIQMNNDHVDAYYMRGLLHEGRRDYEDAKMNYEYALSLDANHQQAAEGLKRISRKI